jgi:exportin-2 (importin alpha re-exporter)
LRKDAPALVTAGHLPAILGVFQKLLAAKTTEEHAFSLLCTVVANLQPSQFQQYMKDLFQLLLMRLQSNKTVKYIRYFTHFLCLLAVIHSSALVVQSFEACQPGVFAMILEHVWVPNFSERLQLSDSETKVFGVGMTTLLCDGTIDANLQLWGKTLQALMLMLAPEEAASTVKGDITAATTANVTIDHDGDEASAGFDSQYSKLHFATTEVGKDWLPQIADVRMHVAQQLSLLTQRTRGRYTSVMQQCLTQHQQAELQSYCTQAGVALA